MRRSDKPGGKAVKAQRRKGLRHPNAPKTVRAVPLLRRSPQGVGDFGDPGHGQIKKLEPSGGADREAAASSKGVVCRILSPRSRRSLQDLVANFEDKAFLFGPFNFHRSFSHGVDPFVRWRRRQSGREIRITSAAVMKLSVRPVEVELHA